MLADYMDRLLSSVHTTLESTHVHFWHECEKLHFCPFWCYFTGLSVRVCISVMMPINDVPRKLSWNGPMSMWTCFLYLRVCPRALLISVWEDVFWTVTNCDKSGILTSQFVVCGNLWWRPWRGIVSSITLKTCSGYLGEYPCSPLTYIMKTCIFAHFGVILLLYVFVCMYINYKAHNRCTKEISLIVSDVDVNTFPALRSIPSGPTVINLRSCVLNRHKLRQSQIVTNQESLSSQFVICRNLWWRPWRHKMSPITPKTCSGYLGEYPCSLWHEYEKLYFCPFWCYFIGISLCISVIMPINDVPRKFLEMVRCLCLCQRVFCTWEYTLGHYLHQSEKLCFEPSQIATVTNCDKSGIPVVAICVLSQFMIKAVTAQTIVQ